VPIVEAFTLALALVLGLLFGSFGNVVIWRVPRGESVVSPGSHCGSCGHPVRWYDNIPVVSWLVLKGRCRDCGARISPRYLIVEIASGVLFVAAVVVWGASVRAVFGTAFLWFLLVLSLIDLEHYRLPNVLVAMLVGIGILGVAVFQLGLAPAVPLTPLAPVAVLAAPLGNALVGALIGIGISGGTAALYALVRRRRGLGMGDIKLLGALGIFLGPYVVLALFLGSVLGVVVGLILRRNRTLAETRIPFGPWLAVGAVLAALFGPDIMRWYFGIAGLG